MELLDVQEKFVLENPTGSYKDFELKNPEDYPIPGVNFYADYGYLPGFTGEDGHELDFFIGTDENGHNGFFIVWRSDEVPEEHKFYIRMSGVELDKTIDEYRKVFVRQQELSVEEVVEAIKQFAD